MIVKMCCGGEIGGSRERRGEGVVVRYGREDEDGGVFFFLVFF